MHQNLKWGAALMLALATFTAPALADGGRHGRDGYRGHDRYDARRDDRHDRHDRRQDRRYARHDRRDDRHDRRDRRDYDRYAYRAPVRVVHHRPVARHYAPAPRHHRGPPPWARGRYVHHYQQYPVYVVHDYRGHGLRHPPRGHRWMRDDYGDFLLVAIATGVIADLILR